MNDFLRQCLQKDPQKRPSAYELLQHPWLNGVREEDSILEKYINKASYRIKNGFDDDSSDEDSYEDDSESYIDDSYDDHTEESDDSHGEGGGNHLAPSVKASRRKSVNIVTRKDNKIEVEQVTNPAIYTVKGMVAFMRHPSKGVKLKTRHHFFKTYKKCFVGLLFPFLFHFPSFSFLSFFTSFLPFPSFTASCPSLSLHFFLFYFIYFFSNSFFSFHRKIFPSSFSSFLLFPLSSFHPLGGKKGREGGKEGRGIFLIPIISFF